MPNFEAIGKYEYYTKQAVNTYEKRRKWAFEITRLIEPLMVPELTSSLTILSEDDFDRAVEELKKFNNELKITNIELEKADRELNKEV